MEVYTVTAITEADFGCEETGREEPAALLRLTPTGGDETGMKRVEVAESVLAEQGIAEGKKVCFAADGTIRKYVRVVAAVIRDRKEHGDRIFATARGYGEYKGWWEFPGGKIEPGETPEQALEREIFEELDTRISVGKLIKTIEYDYPKFHLSMDCFWATIVEGHLELKEAEDARWLAMEELRGVDWLPADLDLVEEILAENAGKGRNMNSITIQKIGITNLALDAVVNAANDRLDEGGGVCGHIFRGAGSAQMTAACRKIGGCPTGSAVITPGFRLPAKYVIHAVGPIWSGGRRNEQKLLYSAYRQSLLLAKENGLQSIGFPLISSGIYGYPVDGAWRTAIAACRDFLKDFPEYAMEIVFAVIDDRVKALGEALLGEIE